MSAAREALQLILSDRLGLRAPTIRRIVDRLPAGLVQSIVVESTLRDRANQTAVDCQGILPCPFCGGRGDFEPAGNSVMCDDCGAIGGEHENTFVAVARWNCRVPVTVLLGKATGGGEG